MSFVFNEGINFDLDFKKRPHVLNKDLKIFSLNANFRPARNGLGSAAGEQYRRAKKYPLIERMRILGYKVNELIDVIPTFTEHDPLSVPSGSYPNRTYTDSDTWMFHSFSYDFLKGKDHDGGGFRFWKTRISGGSSAARNSIGLPVEFANTDNITNTRIRMLVIAI